MNKTTQKSKQKECDKQDSCRVFKSDKEVIKKIKDKVKSFGGNLTAPEIVNLSLSLIKEEDLKLAILKKRKGRDRTSLLTELWLRENPKKTFDDAEDFKLTQGWLEFVDRNRHLIQAA